MVAVLAYVASCYDPHFAVGLECSSAGTCPPGQLCQADRRCHSSGEVLIDASSPDAPVIDALVIDAPMIDAPPPRCTVSPQAGCPIDDKCTVVQDATSTTCTAAGAVELGGPCTGFGSADDCVAGAVCSFGVCTAFCTLSGSDCAVGSTCITFPVDPNGGAFEACAVTCDPLAQNCPPTMMTGSAGCYVAQVAAGSSDVASVCEGSMGIPLGFKCRRVNECVPGTECLTGSNGSATCHGLCNFSAFPNQQGTCGSGQTCQELLDQTGACL